MLTIISTILQGWEELVQEGVQILLKNSTSSLIVIQSVSFSGD